MVRQADTLGETLLCCGTVLLQEELVYKLEGIMIKEHYEEILKHQPGSKSSRWSITLNIQLKLLKSGLRRIKLAFWPSQSPDLIFIEEF